MLPIRVVIRPFWLYHKDARGCEQVNNGDNASRIEDAFCEGYLHLQWPRVGQRSRGTSIGGDHNHKPSRQWPSQPRPPFASGMLLLLVVLQYLPRSSMTVGMGVKLQK